MGVGAWLGSCREVELGPPNPNMLPQTHTLLQDRKRYEDTTGLDGPRLSPELHPGLIQGFWGLEGGLASPGAPHRLSLRSLLPRRGT